jgi:Fe-S-cluster containining protein
MFFLQKPVFFSCNQCGACCRDYAIPLSVRDILRLLEAHPTRSVRQLLRLRSAPEDDIEALLFDSAYWHLLLQRTAEGCIFLEADHRCGTYDSRPRACSNFPFDLAGRHVRILPDALPAYEQHCSRDRVSRATLKQARTDSLIGSQEFSDYREWVSHWNAWAIQHPEQQTLERFIAFIQTEASEENLPGQISPVGG